MTGTEGLPFSEAERRVAQRHPGWHVWHTETICWASEALKDGGGVTLDGATPEQLDQRIAEYEHEHAVAA